MNILLKRRLTKFFKMKRASISAALLLLLILASILSPFLANNKPLLLIFKSKAYFPLFTVYKENCFHGDSIFEPQYKDLVQKDEVKEQINLIIWPPIQWGVNESNEKVAIFPSAPTRENLLGTDDRGRDVFTRLLHGFRVSLFFSFINYFFAVILGMLIGGAQGYLGGKVDIIGQRAIEIWSAIPFLSVLLLLGSVFEPGLVTLSIISALFSWIGLSTYIRAETLRVRKEDFVIATKTLGASDRYIFFKHILPNSLTPLVTFTPFILSSGILFLSVLDFLGFGVQAPTPSIGELLNQGHENITSAWWLILFPGLSLVSVILMLNFIAEGIRFSLDSKSNG